MPVQATCPGCAASLAFRDGALVVVCDHCKAVVARGDRDLENLGKVVDLADTGSPLELFLRGAWRGAAFELCGRAQLQHGMGGLWDEWYVAFDDGRWGWLAEAQGRFYLSFEAPGEHALPPFDEVSVGAPIAGFPGPAAVVAAEKGRARYVAAQGSVPFRLVPGAEYPYVDASGPDGVFGTIDYGERPPAVYVGREVTLAELGLAGVAIAERAAPAIRADRIACPECDGNLELAAPGEVQRIACPYCGQLLDVTAGKLEKLQLKQQVRAPAIPIGAKGKLRGAEYKVIGYAERFVTFDGTKYFWEEYLLHAPGIGFRWLVQSDGAWSFVEPVAPGDVQPTDTGPVYRGRAYALFQEARAEVSYVLGEFYWKVAPGETVRATDYVAPPTMLSCEQSADEVNWSLGTWLPVAEVEAAFGVKLPPQAKVAPHQPYPHDGIFRWWGILVAAALMLIVGLSCTQPKRVVLAAKFTLTPPATPEATQVFYSEPFALASRRNLQVSAWADVNNSWAWVEGHLINEETGWVRYFALALEKYQGHEAGEAWSEGKGFAKTVLSAAPGGVYVLRVEVSSGTTSFPGPTLGSRIEGTHPTELNVVIRQGVPRPWHAALLLALISAIPVGVFFHRRAFEKERWQDSDHSPYGGSGSGDDGDDGDDGGDDE